MAGKNLCCPVKMMKGRLGRPFLIACRLPEQTGYYETK
jgi:hypothetical protein